MTEPTPIRSSVRRALDDDEVGHGHLVGVFRPEYGDHHGELQCDNCGAGWVGQIGEECGWCQRAVERSAVDSRLSELEEIKEVLHLDDTADPLAQYKEQKLDWPTFWSADHKGEDWVAHPLIPAGRLTALYAPAKQGKSEVALVVVAAIASGKPILAQPNNEGPRNVIYLDYEMTQSDLNERLLLLGYDADDDLSHLHYWSLPSLPPLDTPEGCAVLRGLAKEYEAEAVVIDTMGRAVEGDENSNDTYRNFARFTGLGLKADGVAVLRTDHAGKDKEKGQRGASAKNDDADVVFRVDQIDTGWRLQRTHTRISWVPESVLIERDVRADKTLRVALEPSQRRVFMPGIPTYAKSLIAKGVWSGQGRDKLKEAARAAGIAVHSNDFMSDVVAWLKENASTDSCLSAPDDLDDLI